MGCGSFQEPPDGRADFMGLFPDLPKPGCGQGCLFGSEDPGPGWASVRKRPLDPVQADDDAQGAPRVREDGEVRRPSSQRGRAKLHSSGLEKTQYPGQVVFPLRVGEKGEGFFFQGLGIDLGYQEPQAPKASYLPFR
jgi:hypothetical protein